MLKKLLVSGAAAALFIGSATGVFASRHEEHHVTLPTTTVVNTGDIHNTSVNVANTGLNYGGGSEEHSRHHSGNSVTTGDATASQLTDNEINTVVGCGCATGGNLSVTNHGDISNQSWNVANTGLNAGGSVHTGNAAAGQEVDNWINTGTSSL